MGRLCRLLHHTLDRSATGPDSLAPSEHLRNRRGFSRCGRSSARGHLAAGHRSNELNGSVCTNRAPKRELIRRAAGTPGPAAAATTAGATFPQLLELRLLLDGEDLFEPRIDLFLQLAELFLLSSLV